MQSQHPVRVLGQAVATGAVVTATAAAPGAGLLNYITGLLIVVTQLAAQAAAGFDLTTTGLGGADITIPLANSGTPGSVISIPILFPNPVQANAVNAVVSAAATPTANTRVSIVLLGFTAP